MQKFSKISCIVIIHIKLSIELNIENVYISLQRELVLRWNLFKTFSKVSRIVIVHIQLSSELNFEIVYVSV